MSITNPDIYYKRFPEYSYEQIDTIIYGENNNDFLKKLRMIRTIVLILFLGSLFLGHRSAVKTVISWILFIGFVALAVYITWLKKVSVKGSVGDNYDRNKLAANIMADRTYEVLSQNFSDIKGFSYDDQDDGSLGPIFQDRVITETEMNAAYGVPAWFYERNGFTNTPLVDRLDDEIRFYHFEDKVSETNNLKIAASYSGAEFYYSGVKKETCSVSTSYHVLGNAVKLATNVVAASYNISGANRYDSWGNEIPVGQREKMEYASLDGPDEKEKIKTVNISGLIFEHTNPMIKGMIEFASKSCDTESLKFADSPIKYTTGNEKFDKGIKIYSKTDGVEEIRSFLTPQIIQAILAISEETFIYDYKVIADSKYIIVLLEGFGEKTSIHFDTAKDVLDAKIDGSEFVPFGDTINFIKVWFDVLLERKLAGDGNTASTPKFTPAPAPTPSPVPQQSASPNLFCRQCGAEILAGRAFCSKCGTKVE